MPFVCFEPQELSWLPGPSCRSPLTARRAGTESFAALKLLPLAVPR